MPEMRVYTVLTEVLDLDDRILHLRDMAERSALKKGYPTPVYRKMSPVDVYESLWEVSWYVR